MCAFEPEKYTLTKLQKNAVFAVVTGAGFSPVDFKWETVTRTGTTGSPSMMFISKLVYAADKQYFFTFNTSPAYPSVEYAPAGEHHRVVADGGKWEFVMASVAHWLGHLRYELDEPDLWARLGTATAGTTLSLVPTIGGADTPFTAAEQHEILARLANFRLAVEQKFALSGERQEQVAREVAKLMEQAGHAGRTSWFQLAIGVALTLGLSLAPNAPSQVFDLMSQAFAGALRLVSG